MRSATAAPPTSLHARPQPPTARSTSPATPAGRSPTSSSRAATEGSASTSARPRPTTRCRGLLDVIDAAAPRPRRHASTSCSAAPASSSSARHAPPTPSSPARPRGPRSSSPQGHPDILVLREGGGRLDALRLHAGVPRPVRPALAHLRDPGADRRDRAASSTARRGRGRPRHRADAGAQCRGGRRLVALVDRRTRRTSAASASCSTEHWPDVPVTLGHRLNPSLREYGATSSAAIDASLKPLMSRFFQGLEQRLARRTASTADSSS